MIRLIKRYESRKLYDTEESRYVSLEDIAQWVRQGQQVRVIDNSSSEDVTAQTLTQIILEEGRRGTSLLPIELLHELVRLGERAVASSVEQVQQRLDRLVRGSFDRLSPVRQAREEMSVLRQRLEQLEASLVRLETERETGPASSSASSARSPVAQKRGRKTKSPGKASARRRQKPQGD